VFSVGSLCFGGSLVEDAMLQKIVGNVLDECLRPELRLASDHVGDHPFHLPGVG